MTSQEKIVGNIHRDEGGIEMCQEVGRGVSSRVGIGCLETGSDYNNDMLQLLFIYLFSHYYCIYKYFQEISQLAIQDGWPIS